MRYSKMKKRGVRSLAGVYTSFLFMVVAINGLYFSIGSSRQEAPELKVEGQRFLASVPTANEIVKDTVIYQDLHELPVKKVQVVDFGSDVQRLESQESRYHESLPLRVREPLKRIDKQPYIPRSQRRS